jgi:hypothetical protein
MTGSEQRPLPVFVYPLKRTKPGGFNHFYAWNKYNPRYNLRTMIRHVETAKLRIRGNMANKNNDNQDKSASSNGIHSGFFEIHVKGHLDDSWSDWLEGLEVKLLDTGEMILFGHIGDQAALMGILNKLYRLNLALLSVSEVNQKK